MERLLDDVRLAAHVVTHGGYRNACASCGRVLDTRPSLLVDLPNGKVAAIVGDPPPAQPLHVIAGVTGHNLAVYRDEFGLLNDLLRDERPRLLELVEARRLGGGQYWEWAQANWPRFSSRTFLAARLMAAGKFDVKFLRKDGEISDEADVLSLLASVQALLVIAAAERAGNSSEVTLETLLERLIAPGAVLPAAVAQLEDLLRNSDFDPAQEYVLRAFTASAHATAGEPDPGERAWARAYVGMEIAAQADPDAWSWYRIARRRARQTVSFRAAWIVATAARSAPDATQLKIDRALAECGWAGLVAAALPALCPAELDPASSIDDLVKFATRPDDSLPVTARAAGVASMLMFARRPSDIALLLVAAIKAAPAERDDLLAGLGDLLVTSGGGAAFLEVAGIHPEGPAHVDIVRADALNAVGLPKAGLKAADAALSRTEHDLVATRARHAKAVALAANNEIEAAYAVMEEQVASARPFTLTMAFTRIWLFLQLGLHDAALEAWVATTRALEKEGGLSHRWETRIDVLRGLFAVNGSLSDAAEILRRLEGSEGDEVCAEVLALAWARQLRYHPQAEDVAYLRPLLLSIEDAATRARTNGARATEVRLVRAVALLRDALRSPLAEVAWLRESQLRHDLGQPDPVVMAALALHRYRRGDRARAIAQLEQVTPSLARQLRGVDTLNALWAPIYLLEILVGVTEAAYALYDGLPSAEFRFLAELQRDAVGRSRRLHNAGSKPLPSTVDDLSDGALVHLAPPRGTLHILEWLYTENGVVCGLVTHVNANGVHSTGVDHDAAPLLGVARELYNRLQSWTPRRRGDPFDTPGWTDAQRFFLDVVQPSEGDHVVVIAHEKFNGLPWHAVEGATWTTSYAAGWTELLSLPARPRRPRIGILQVPAADEPPSTLAAFARSRARLAALAAELKLEFLDVSRNGNGATTVFEAADVAVLHCHGVLSNARGGIALRVRAAPGAGVLDLAESDVFSWMDADVIAQAPYAVFSAACSTGLTLMTPVGETASLYATLRHRGTAVVVAPGWDAVATDAVELVDATVEAYLRGGTMAAAVYDASAALALPRWRANVLTIHGDWR